MRTNAARPPAWLISSTAVLTLLLFGMAVTETSQWGHYLIDKGERVSLFGLGFILIATVLLYRKQRLRVSLPFTLPWLIYPAITQGDQIIDNLSITTMIVICQVLLTLIFWLPVTVIIHAAKYGVRSRGGLSARARSILTLVLLALELLVAYRLLGMYMVATLVAMMLFVAWRMVHGETDRKASWIRTERAALVAMLAGIAVSLGLYIGYKNRPGAYQGSPSYLFDPSQPDAGYKIDRIKVRFGANEFVRGSLSTDAALVFGGYADALQELANGYYILDRNYTHHFHNVLFARNWPILANFRAVALGQIADARAHAAAVRIEADRIRTPLADYMAVTDLLNEIEGYLAYNFERAAILESMSAKFIESDDGLQHAAHLYEGEGKLLGMGLGELLDKHKATIEASALAQPLARFNLVTRALFNSYKDRIVGF